MNRTLAARVTELEKRQLKIEKTERKTFKRVAVKKDFYTKKRGRG